MTHLRILLLLILIISSCKRTQKDDHFTIAFGSCNNQHLENNLWKEIEKNHPDVWIWGGDIIYSDTEDMSYLKRNYLKQKSNSKYINFIKNIDVLATWDDHDYGLNDGGTEYSKKATSQQLFLDFLDVDKNDARRKQEGIYTAKDYVLNNHSIKIIVLDTRYFRTALTPDTETKKRYKPNTNEEGTILGDEQWKWFAKQLQSSEADFNIIISSIQFLSSEHGFESWGTMPHEVDRLEKLLIDTEAKNTIILSGDRHISEFSKKHVDGLDYPLIDFTSSGLTHSYTNFKEEINPYRLGEVVSEKSFGVLKFNFKDNKVTMEIRGENNTLYETYTQNY